MKKNIYRKFSKCFDVCIKNVNNMQNKIKTSRLATLGLIRGIRTKGMEWKFFLKKSQVSSLPNLVKP